MILPSDVIVLVTDGGRMLLLRNAGDATSPDLAVIEHRDSPPPPNREILSDAPGRSFESASPARSAYDNRDPHAAEERAFVDAALTALAEQVDRDTPGVIIAADPVSLGHLRQNYPPQVREKLLTEFDKNLTGMPVEAITRYLCEAAFPPQG
jgi:protein required for attachment to host cells